MLECQCNNAQCQSVVADNQRMFKKAYGEFEILVSIHFGHFCAFLGFMTGTNSFSKVNPENHPLNTPMLKTIQDIPVCKKSRTSLVKGTRL